MNKLLVSFILIFLPFKALALPRYPANFPRFFRDNAGYIYSLDRQLPLLIQYPAIAPSTRPRNRRVAVRQGCEFVRFKPPADAVNFSADGQQYQVNNLPILDPPLCRNGELYVPASWSTFVGK